MKSPPVSSVMVVWEGTRPLLVEIQALVDHSMMSNPRRVAVGLEQNRLAILLAVLHPSRRPTDGRSGRLRQCGRRGEGHGKPAPTWRCCWRWSPACATVLCRKIWWSLAKWGWPGNSPGTERSGAYLRSGEARLPPRHRPGGQCAEKSAGRHANLWREKAFRRAKRF
ncbi:DNA repair protein RadA [Klebsiella pneumoniae]|uniref:DNA repair protein RadA n=1 Tax=Klebsiella pneumoniae TaxID=573 RepID=A0A377UWH7_KLEPN|nr:DNA repair protein RadA [Klebsiella pneumoniae]